MPGVWEDGKAGAFVYEEQARTAALHRSKHRSKNWYRVTNPHTGVVVAVYRGGRQVEGDLSATQPKEGGTTYRADFYRSEASKKPTGEKTGANAPAKSASRWTFGTITPDYAQAVATYNTWVTSGYYKRSRLVEVDEQGYMMRTVLDSANDIEGTGTLGNSMQEPLTIPRLTIIEKIEAQQAGEKERHDKAQQQLFDDNKARLAKMEKVAADPWIVLRMYEQIFGASTLEGADADKLFKKASDNFGRQPGTIEYKPSESAEKLKSVLNAATDENIKVLPGDDVYSYL